MLQTVQCLPSGAIATLKFEHSFGEIDGPSLASKIPPIYVLAPREAFSRVTRLSGNFLKTDAQPNLCLAWDTEQSPRAEVWRRNRKFANNSQGGYWVDDIQGPSGCLAKSLPTLSRSWCSLNWGDLQHHEEEYRALVG